MSKPGEPQGKEWDARPTPSWKKLESLGLDDLFALRADIEAEIHARLEEDGDGEAEDPGP